MDGFNEQDIKILKDTTVLQLAQQLEDALINKGIIRNDMNVFEFIKYYMNG